MTAKIEFPSNLDVLSNWNAQHVSEVWELRSEFSLKYKLDLGNSVIEKNITRLQTNHQYEINPFITRNSNKIHIIQWHNPLRLLSVFNRIYIHAANHACLPKSSNGCCSVWFHCVTAFKQKTRPNNWGLVDIHGHTLRQMNAWWDYAYL